MVIAVKQTDVLIGSDSEVLWWFMGTITSCLLSSYFRVRFDAWEWDQEMQYKVLGQDALWQNILVIWCVCVKNFGFNIC